MIYFDSTYVARIYLFEHGSSEVRALAASQAQVACCDIGKIEVSSVFHRKLREGALDASRYRALSQQFEQDLQGDVWIWLSTTAALLDAVRLTFQALPATVFLRANDALHLLCAREHGFGEIHSNDRHLLAAARHLGMPAVNVIPAPAI